MATESLLGNRFLSAIKWHNFPKSVQHSKGMDVAEFWAVVFNLISELDEILDLQSPNLIEEKNQAQRGNMIH